MVGSALALSLIGLSAVQALPTGKTVEERQLWLGPGSGIFIPGDGGELHTCLTDVPLQEQPPCILPPLVGGLEPSTKKREVEKRQFWLGPGSGTFTPGNGQPSTCLTNVPLQEQPPCILPPIVGGLEPSTRKKRQVIIGDPSGGFVPGQGELPPCLVDGTPINEQPPCILPPIVGGLEPSTKTKRQLIIGDGTGVFIPGQGAVPVCLVDVPLNEQPPCMLPPIVGGVNPSTKAKRQLIIGDGTGAFIPGQGEAPVCLVDVPLNEQPPCMLPPIVGGLEPSTKKRGFVLPSDYATNTKRVIEELERDLIGLQNKRNKSKQDLEDIEAIKGALMYLAGITSISAPPGTGSTFTPGKRGFVLPPDYATNTKKVIQTLEKELIRLQNKKNKTQEDRSDIEAIRAALRYLAGITSISAPPGTGSTFTPGKRGFTLPPDYATNTKQVIVTLEKELIRLQNKKNKTQEDRSDIEAIKAALMYLAGISSISAPPGTGSTFTPGKRDAEFSLDTVGAYSSVCPNLAGAELALEALMHKDKPTLEERIVMQQLAAFLKGCGITIVKSPDGTWTTIKPSDKRDVSAQFDVTGLQTAYFILLQAATDLYPSQPSFDNWLALQHISGLLELHGASTTLTVDSAGHPKRQTDTITVGTRTCQVIDVMALRAALAALITSYGDPSKAPTHIFLVEQVLVTALQLCGQSVAGWTTIIPGSPVPGGPMIPDPTVPGGPMVPDPTVPGGEIKPSDKKKRQALVAGADPAAMLAALTTLEQAYGAYGSGKIPAPVFLIMVNIVTILQGIPGVVVPGWPVLGQGSVVLTPST